MQPTITLFTAWLPHPPIRAPYFSSNFCINKSQQQLSYWWINQRKTPYQKPIKPFLWLRIVQSPAMEMPQKRLRILHKLVSKSKKLLRISILLTKMKKPMIQKLIFLKKSRKLKRFKLLKHYNNGFRREYQFDSPSSTPLIHYYNRKGLKDRSIQDIDSVLFWCKCFGCLKAQVRGEADYRLALKADLPAAIGRELDLEEDKEDSVDERAERFIERFYAEMRLHRQESF